jgi:hypothetical protein
LSFLSLSSGVLKSGQKLKYNIIMQFIHSFNKHLTLTMLDSKKSCSLIIEHLPRTFSHLLSFWEADFTISKYWNFCIKNSDPVNFRGVIEITVWVSTVQWNFLQWWKCPVSPLCSKVLSSCMWLSSTWHVTGKT